MTRVADPPRRWGFLSAVVAESRAPMRFLPDARAEPSGRAPAGSLSPDAGRALALGFNEFSARADKAEVERRDQLIEPPVMLLQSDKPIDRARRAPRAEKGRRTAVNPGSAEPELAVAQAANPPIPSPTADDAVADEPVQLSSSRVAMHPHGAAVLETTNRVGARGSRPAERAQAKNPASHGERSQTRTEAACEQGPGPDCRATPPREKLPRAAVERPANAVDWCSPARQRPGGSPSVASQPTRPADQVAVSPRRPGAAVAAPQEQPAVHIGTLDIRIEVPKPLPPRRQKVGFSGSGVFSRLYLQRG
jgi:hypothetical protein